VKRRRAQACAVRQRLVPRGPQLVTTWRVQVPPTLRFVFEGELPSYLLAKDLILQVIGEISVAGGTYKAMEFTGPVVDAMTMEDRMMLCNMVVEAGGKNGTAPLVCGQGVCRREREHATANSARHLSRAQGACIARRRSLPVCCLAWSFPSIGANACRQRLRRVREPPAAEAIALVPARAGTCPPDQTTFDYVRERTSEPFEPVYADDAASYVQEYRFDVSKLQPLVAAPHSPDNRKNAAECRDVKIDRVYIGCAPQHWPGRAWRFARLVSEIQ